MKSFKTWITTVPACYRFNKCITEKSGVVRWDGMPATLRMDFSSAVTGYEERHKRTCSWKWSTLAALSILTSLLHIILFLCMLVLLRWTSFGRLFDKFSPPPKGMNKKNKRNFVTLLWDGNGGCTGNEYRRTSSIQDNNIQINENDLCNKHSVK